MVRSEVGKNPTPRAVNQGQEHRRRDVSSLARGLLAKPLGMTVHSTAIPAAPLLDSGERRPSARVAGLMAFAIGAVAALAYWDSRREAESALSDFAAEQATLARGIASAVAARARAAARASPVLPSSAELLADVRSVERPSDLRLLLSRPGQAGLSTSDGRILRASAVERGLSDGIEWVRIERDAAPSFGLPKRTAVAGLATFQGPEGRWGLVVAATALRERDRESRAVWRSVAAVLLASGLVLVFGGLAMRKQRKELELARELDVNELEREREEQLVQIDKLATMAALATGVAHEVSTPLGVIVGRAEQLIPKVAGDERASRSVQAIIEQGSRISHVVRGFLDLCRGETPSLERVSPGAVARAAGELVEHRFEKAGVELALEVGEGAPEVACDPRLLEQAVINLLLNACDACEKGGKVELSVGGDPERVRFVVTDDGCGITEEAATRATEPFFTTKPEGTGLGLAIATEIVKHYGGHLSLSPRGEETGGLRRGTRASIELPAAKVPA